MVGPTPEAVHAGGGGGDKLPEWFNPNTGQFTRSWRQAMPPKGGFPTIRHRYLSPSKGINMRTAWALLGGLTVFGLYQRQLEQDQILNLKDDFHARTNAIVPYMETENQLKDLIALHYEKEYRHFVAPGLRLDPNQFFNHPIPGAVGEYLRRLRPKRSSKLRFAWEQPEQCTEPISHLSLAREKLPDKYERMLGFTVYEGPAF